MSDWKTFSVAELASSKPSAIAIGPFGSRLTADNYTKSGVPIVRGQNITDAKVLDERDVVYVPQTLAQSLRSCIVHPGDLVFPHRGAIGRVGIVTGHPWLLSTSMMKVSLNPEVASPDFVLYYFRGPGRAALLEHSSVVGTPGIAQPLTALKGAKIRLPPLPEQRAIADVLGALDDKIAANDRILCLQDEWIRAVFNTLRLESRTLGSVATAVKEQRRPSELPDGTRYFGLEHIPRRLMWASEAGTVAEVTSAKLSFARNDVLFGKLRPYFHKVVSAGSSGVCSTDIIVVRAVGPELAGFVLAACAADETVHACVASSDGTRMPRTNWKDLAAVRIRWPGESRAREFSSQVIARSDLAHVIIQESRRLADARDELLLLLMSGRVQVRDAVKVVEEVT